MARECLVAGAHWVRDKADDVMEVDLADGAKMKYSMLDDLTGVLHWTNTLKSSEVQPMEDSGGATTEER